MQLRLPAALCLAFVLGLPGSLRATGPAERLEPGSRIEALPVKGTTYLTVEIRSINPRTAFITHAAGMCSIPLRELSPEWQARFGYDAALDVEKPATAPAVRRMAVPAPRPRENSSALEEIVKEFGKPALLQPSVDLRPKIFELKLAVKDQGRRPSCAIFAVVSALEYENAQVTGRADKFSEEYLSWATHKITRRPLPAARTDNDADTMLQEDADEGFALNDVVAALRGYGVPLQSTMPNHRGGSLAEIEEPAPAIIAEAQSHQKIAVFTLPGNDNVTRLNNAIHVLNSGRPIVVGMAWPGYRSLRSGYLNRQVPLPQTGHAVTLVGYTSESGKLEDAVFVFKNSWGVNWGRGGYGNVTFSYLSKYLNDSLFIEVRP